MNFAKLIAHLRSFGLGLLWIGFFLTANGLTNAQTVTVVHNFSGPDGEFPRYGTLTQGRDGTLYGTTQSVSTNFTGGELYKQRTLSDSNVKLYTFENSFVDGGLTLGRDGNLYGAESGGSSSYGAIFRIDTHGTLTVLYTFTGGADGIYPVAAPIQALDGNFYGVTSGGTINFIPSTVYRLTRTGELTTIYTFPTDVFPVSPAVQAADGSLFIVTPSGGKQACGSIVRLTTSGVVKGTYSFSCREPNPAGPVGSLIQASDGFLYGTTQGGGPSKQGTVFKLDVSAKTLTVLYNFGSITNDGMYPQAGLIQGSDGNFYGTTTAGGANGYGSIFKLTPDGTYTQLYSFPSAPGGQPAFPEATLLQHTNGAFYGTTENGGSAGLGSIFKLDMGLAPIISFVNSTGRVGTPVEILGQGLTGTTSVAFNGVSANSFSVVSDSYMTAVVPSGATTGRVTVTTPGGNVTSGVDFNIAP